MIECECRCVRVFMYELVIALTQDKAAMWEMFELSEVDIMRNFLMLWRTL